MSQNAAPAATAKPPAPPASQQQQQQQQQQPRVHSMKKFSKLFAFTRLGRPRPEDAVAEWEALSAATRESSPDVHQIGPRRRRRLRDHESEIKRPARNGLSRIVADEGHPPCPLCANFDFPRLLNWRPGQPRPWIPLAHTLAAPDDTTCPYCIFFQALVGALPDQTKKFTPYLRIRQAFERFGISEKHELGGVVLLEVTTKTKALPRGYVVRVVEGSDDLAGYREATPAIRGRLIPPRFDAALPKSWLDFCVTHHPHTRCASTGPPLGGLRLIDCNTNDVIFIEDSNADAPGYATLSYVRGDELDEEEKFEGKRLPDKLPVLFADAISVAKSLGFRYLWIDRYCFPEYSTTERWRQLDRMGDIYQHSALTLVVAAGEGVSDGIPGVSVDREEQLSLQTDAGFFTTSLIRPDAEVATSKWASRGWTYQEGLLSRRRLVFTPSQIYFQCQTLHCHESISFPLQTNPALNLGRVFSADGAGTRSSDFKAQVSAYSGREFTHREDRLDAFRGVLDRYASMDPPVENLLGMPLFHLRDFKDRPTVSQTDRLAVGLGWKQEYVGENSELKAQVHATYPMCLDGPFPSWTWLGWKLRPESSDPPPFQLYEVGDVTPIVNNVSASPSLGISIGFRDKDEVLPWEEQGPAIATTVEPIAFIRLKAYCFDIRLHRDDDGVVTIPDLDLLDAHRPLVTQLLERAASDESTAEPPAGDHDLFGLLLSGRDWKADAFESACILICGRRGWKEDGQLVRLGTLEIQAGTLVAQSSGSGASTNGMGLTGLLNEEKKLDVKLRELDIY